MKKSYFIISIIVTLSISASFAQKSSKKTPEPEYEFPAQMLPHVQEGYKVEFERGKVLYDINCGKCHNKKVKGKIITPNFTPEQFEAYKIRISNAQHEQNLGEEKMAADELGFIITYLTYKRKNPTTSSK